MAANPLETVVSAPTPSPALLQRISAGDEDSCSELLGQWEHRVRRIASKYAARRSDEDDLQQAGRLALLRAARNYNPSLGTPFSHYANRSIRLATIRESNRLQRQRCLASCSLDENPQAIRAMAIGGDGAAVMVADWIGSLPELQRQIYRLLYVEGRTQREAAATLDLTQPRVAQLKSQLLSLGRLSLAA